MLTMRILLLLTVLVFAGNGVVQSQPPPPAPPKHGQHQEPYPKQPAQNPSTPNGKTNNPPLTVTLDGPVTIQKSDRDRNDEREEGQRKASSDWGLVIATGVLAGVTLILAGITGFLARYTFKLWDDASKANRRQAAQFEAIERPYIYVFGVSQLQIAESSDPRTQPYLTYTIANYGNTPAVIVWLKVGIFTSPDAEPSTQGLTAYAPHPAVDFPIFAPKDKRVLNEELPGNIKWSQGSAIEPFATVADPDTRDGWEMYFRVTVSYSGPFTKGHESSFCWRLDRMTARFIQFGHEEYNYTK